MNFGTPPPPTQPEIESEAWWKLVYEGKIVPASDRPRPK